MSQTDQRCVLFTAENPWIPRNSTQSRGYLPVMPGIERLRTEFFPAWR